MMEAPFQPPAELIQLHRLKTAAGNVVFSRGGKMLFCIKSSVVGTKSISKGHFFPLVHTGSNFLESGGINSLQIYGMNE